MRKNSKTNLKSHKTNLIKHGIGLIFSYFTARWTYVFLKDDSLQIRDYPEFDSRSMEVFMTMLMIFASIFAVFFSINVALSLSRLIKNR